METPLIVPNSEPFFLPGGPTGCLLLHSFTSMPEEMRWMARFIERRIALQGGEVKP
jgi:esterase/lipase